MLSSKHPDNWDKAAFKESFIAQKKASLASGELQAMVNSIEVCDAVKEQNANH